MRILGIILPLLFIIISCKINYSLTDGSIDPNIKTFSIATFQTTAANAPASYGQTFTEDLKDQMLNQTRLELVTKDGDVRFEGKINSFTVNPIAISGDNAAQSRLSVTISVKFINTIDPDKNYETTFTRFSDFDANLDLLVVQDGLIQEINEQITLDVFNKSFGDW